jgi:hypothetical protein
VWRKIFRQRWIWFHPRVHALHYNERSIRTLLQRHGLEIVFIRRQRPNTCLTRTAGRLARRVFTRTMNVPSPSLRDRIARTYQDITGAEIYAIARRTRG